jgi:SAM-dependent methyltransferase
MRRNFGRVYLASCAVDTRTARRINRAHWDALAQAHGHGDPIYDVEALLAGADSLREAEAAGVRESVGAVAGLDVLHLQCHIGFDAISLARRGARVVGVDFSPAALEKARTLARRCEVDVEFVEADATKLPVELHNRFDLVYATIGVLVWIDDVRAWMRSAEAALRGGGQLLLVDIHPAYGMVGSLDPLRFDFPYAYDGPRTFDEPGSYAGVELAVAATETVEYGHSLGEVLNAALAAGLRIQHLAEHMDAEYDPRGTVLAREEDGRFRVRVDGEVMPMLFTLVAAKP